MATLKIGSARHDENGAYTGGAAGDQTGTEVSTQTFYNHSKGWRVLRLKKTAYAKKNATAMSTACANENFGYDQGNRTDCLKYGTSSTVKTECDCSSLVRLCVKEATGTDPGNFTTANEATMLAATGLFEDAFDYVSQSKTPLYNGDVLVTKTKGHTAIVVSGNARSSSNAPEYEVGKTYVTKCKVPVRKGPGVSYDQLAKSELTADGQKHADSEGRLKKGTSVTCKGITEKSNGNKWMKIPSGHILVYVASSKTVKVS